MPSCCHGGSGGECPECRKELPPLHKLQIGVHGGLTREERQKKARDEIEEAARRGRELIRQTQLDQLQRARERDVKKKDVLQRARDGGLTRADQRWWSETFPHLNMQNYLKQTELSNYTGMVRLLKQQGYPFYISLGTTELVAWQLSHLAHVLVSSLRLACAKLAERYDEAFRLERMRTGENPWMSCADRMKRARVSARLRLPIPDGNVAIRVRTSPTAAVKRKDTEYGSMVWKVYFMTHATDDALAKLGDDNSKQARPRDDDAPPQPGNPRSVTTVNGLHEALNQQWAKMSAGQQAASNAWFQEVDPVAAGDLNLAWEVAKADGADGAAAGPSGASRGPPMGGEQVPWSDDEDDEGEEDESGGGGGGGAGPSCLQREPPAPRRGPAPMSGERVAWSSDEED